jgi:hypothetical protein
MADTFSTSLEFRLQTVGGNNNSWGTLLNTTISNIDAALGGVAQISLASADVTLSTAQNRNPVIEVTGTLPADRNLVVKTQTKAFWIKNSTSGAYTVTVKTSAGTGVDVPQGEWRLLYCDGTNVETITGSLASYDEVTSALLGADSVDANALATGSVTADALGAGEVGTAALADDGVTLDKLEDGTDGDILYYGASGAPARLNTSDTEDEVLALDADGRPSWQALADIAGFELRGLTDPGHYTWPGGFKVNFGTFTIPDSTSAQAVVFNDEFATTCVGVLLSVNSNIEGASTSQLVAAKDITTTGFNCESQVNNVGGSPTVFYWAVGW